MPRALHYRHQAMAKRRIADALDSFSQRDGVEITHDAKVTGDMGRKTAVAVPNHAPHHRRPPPQDPVEQPETHDAPPDGEPVPRLQCNALHIDDET